MKKIFRLLTCAVAGIAAVAFTGCNDDKPDAASEIIISGDASVAVPKAGGPQTITFASNYDWTATATLTPTGDWCTIAPASGKASTVCTITVTIGANDTETAREATIAIATTKEPALPKTVKFTQAANTDPKDVKVQIPEIDFNLENQPYDPNKVQPPYTMTVLDRNIGAPKIGELGTYFTWDEAMKACPTGYHLMTSNDYADITDANSLNTPEKLRDGVLKLPVSGGYYDGTTQKNTQYAYYWTSDEGWAPRTAPELFEGNWGMEYPNQYKSTLKMQARCVKDAAQ